MLLPLPPHPKGQCQGIDAGSQVRREANGMTRNIVGCTVSESNTPYLASFHYSTWALLQETTGD
jgi:hypothetical protein